MSDEPMTASEVLWRQGVPLHETPEYKAWEVAHPPVDEVLRCLEGRLNRLDRMLHDVLEGQQRLEKALKAHGVGLASRLVRGVAT